MLNYTKTTRERLVAMNTLSGNIIVKIDNCYYVRSVTESRHKYTELMNYLHKRDAADLVKSWKRMGRCSVNGFKRINHGRCMNDLLADLKSIDINCADGKRLSVTFDGVEVKHV